MKALELVGQTFGDLLVLEKAGIRGKKLVWKCRCVCGKETIVFGTHLVRGNSKSCSSGGSHGYGKNTPGYTSYSSMMNRCYNKNHPHYDRYGGRGIAVSESWRQSFYNFYVDMGERPEGKTLDRIDPNGNYELGNCRWATPKEQQNNMRSNHLIELNGKRMTISQFADAYGIKYPTLYSRITKLELGLIDEKQALQSVR